MKLSISIAFLLLMSPILLSQDCRTGIKIKSDLNNIRIFINDSLEFYNTYEIELEEGNYLISISEDSNRWDAKLYTESFYLNNCETKSINIRFLDEILIDSNPQDAKVLDGDELLGYTPLILSQRINRIKLSKQGYFDREVEVNNNISAINVSLEISGQKPKENFFDKPVAKILFGSMIVFGATSAYYKIKADNNFDDYLKTGELKYKERTEQYDMISGITLGLTQINFGYLIYKIFFDN